MPKGTAVHRCVQHVKAKGSNVNPYAVCQAATGQSYATGKNLSDHNSSTKGVGTLYTHKRRHNIA